MKIRLEKLEILHFIKFDFIKRKRKLLSLINI